nr:hypothetical protein [Candidatus Igneacidithiobacillus taiwanensis]
MPELLGDLLASFPVQIFIDEPKTSDNWRVFAGYLAVSPAAEACPQGVEALAGSGFDSLPCLIDNRAKRFVGDPNWDHGTSFSLDLRSPFQCSYLAIIGDRHVAGPPSFRALGYPDHTRGLGFL